MSGIEGKGLCLFKGCGITAMRWLNEGSMCGWCRVSEKRGLNFDILNGPVKDILVTRGVVNYRTVDDDEAIEKALDKHWQTIVSTLSGHQLAMFLRRQ